MYFDQQTGALIPGKYIAKKSTIKWKVKNSTNYPITIEVQTQSASGIVTRGTTTEKFKINLTLQTCLGDATCLWNEALNSIKLAKTIQMAKKEANNFGKSLPI